MHSLLGASWLIPFFPLAGASIVAVLLISFNRTMNRLTKPVSFLVILSILSSTLLTSILLFSHQSGQVIDSQLNFLNQKLHLDFKLDYISEISLLALGLIVLLILIASYFRLPRAKGYVAYVTFLTFLCGLFSLVIISSDLTQSFL